MKIVLNRRKIIATFTLIAVITTLVIAAFVYIFRSSRNDCYQSMKEAAHITDTRLTSIIEAYYGPLQNLVMLTNDYNELKNEVLIEKLMKVRVNVVASPVRLFLPDGFAITEDGIYEDISSVIRYEDLYAEENYTTQMHQDELHPEKEVIDHFVPVKINGVVRGMLSAVMNVKDMEDFVANSSSKGKASLLIVDRRSGRIVINTDKERINYLNEIAPQRVQRGYSIDDFCQCVKNKKPQFLVYKSLDGKINKYLYAIPSAIENWSVIVGMDSKVAFASAYKIRNMLLYLLFGTLLIVFFYIVWSLGETRKEFSDESKEYSEIAKALSHSFAGIYYVNLDDNSYQEFTTTGEYADLPLVDDRKDFFEDARINIQRVAYCNDKEIILNFIKKEKLLPMLGKEDITSPPYRLMIKGRPVFYRLKIIMPKTEAEHIIVAAENIDSEMTREIEQKKKMQEALQKAESANKAKTIFLNNMSHDIRTPMNAIIGFNQLAIRSKDNPVMTQQYLKKVDIASKHLLSLINDVLDMSRIESGKVVLMENPENLEDLVNYLKDIVMADINAKNQTFFVDMEKVEDKFIICDKLRLNQVLLNIVSNAIKYTNEGGTISLTVCEEKKDFIGYSTYEFRVKDNGIGMSKKFLSTIFMPFTRERSSTISGIQGTGLGMSISKNLIEMMDGTIDITSMPERGTEVIIKLPFKISRNEDVEKNKKPKDDGINLVGMKVLLVDDNDFNREIAKIVMEQDNIEVREANNGKDAYDIIRKSKPGDFDLVLMDVQMPQMDGYEATRRIRRLRNKALSKIPIIAMTANAFDEDRRNSLEAGMNEHLAKPVDIDKLKETLRRFWS